MEELLQEAKKYVFERDRCNYLPYYERLERFVIQNEIIIGGIAGLCYMTDNPMDILLNNQWVLYTGDEELVYKLADTLQNAKEPDATALAELSNIKLDNEPDVGIRFVKESAVLSDLVYVQTTINNREFVIYVGVRPLFKIICLNEHRGVKLMDLISPKLYKPVFMADNITNSIKCLPLSLQLIDVYNILYTPAKADLWELYYSMEERLVFGKIGAEKDTSILGGLLESRNKNKRESESIQEDIDKPIKKPYIDYNLTLNNLTKMISGERFILLGDYASDYASDTTKRLQFLSSIEPEDIIKEFNERYPQISLKYIRHQLYMLNDFRLTKYTIYVLIGDMQRPLADVYNSPQYEMIPVIKDSKKNKYIASPAVLLRFIYIDIWNLKFIDKLNPSDNLKRRIKQLRETAHSLRAKQSVYTIFHFENEILPYKGVYTNENSAKKKRFGFSKQPPYFPAKNNFE